MQLKLVCTLLTIGYGVAVDTFQYYRHENFDRSSPLLTSPVCYDRCDVSGLCSQAKTCSELIKTYSCSEYYAPGKQYAGWCDKTCGFAACDPQATASLGSNSRVVDWNNSYSIFDSPREVHVRRYDAFDAKMDLRLGGENGLIRLPEGPAYIFTTAPLLTIHDVTTNTARVIYAQEAAWVSQGSCIQLDMASPAAGATNASVLIVSSGKAVASDKNEGLSGCANSTLVVGYEELHNNPVDYVVQGKCSSVLGGPGGAADFDDLDAPIKPLVAHYHTRGALYYTASGVSNYNDPGEAPITTGEMRFVQWGHYYGPETMWGDDYFVMSFHEADPSARSVAPSNPPSGFQPCAFACLDDPTGTTDEALMKCVLPHNDIKVVA